MKGLFTALAAIVMFAFVTPMIGLSCAASYEKTFSIDLNGQPGSSTWVKLATADFNVDGKPDIAATEYNPGKLTILLGDGSGGFTSSVLQLPQYVSELETADFNRDGKPDLLVGFNNPGITFMVLIGNGQGGFASSFTVDDSVVYLVFGNAAIADFNRDGKPDFAFMVGTLLKVFPGNGSGGFGASVATNLGQSYIDLSADDMNRDGKMDVILIGSLGKPVQLAIFAGNGDGSFGSAIERRSRPVEAHSVSTGDFQSDGDPDIILAERDSSDGRLFATIFLNSGNGSTSNIVTIADMETAIFTSTNNDGLTDIIGSYDGEVHHWNGGTGTFIVRFGLPSLDYGIGIVDDLRTSDLNGDGKSDIILTDSNSVTTGINRCE